MSPEPKNTGSPGAGPRLDDVLANAQDETRRVLERAIEKKKTTGLGLMDILRQDVDRTTFKNIWEFLNKPIGGPAETEGERKVKDALAERGLVSAQDQQELKGGADEYDPVVGHILVDSGEISQAQLDDALAEQERGGQSVWRILVNRGAVSPKQISDARKYRDARLRAAPDGDAIKGILLRHRLADAEKVDAALEERHRTGRDVFQILLDSGAVKKRDLGEALSKEWGLPYLDLHAVKMDPEAAALLPEHVALQNRMAPVRFAGGKVVLAMANPLDQAAMDLFKTLARHEVAPAISFERDIVEAVRRCHAAKAEGATQTAYEKIKSRLHSRAPLDETMSAMGENVGVVPLVASVIEGAINSRATDIHLEPQSYGLRVRYRIDGMLYDIMNLSKQVQPEVLSRVKVLASMDITEHRHPQDGRFSIDVASKRYDLRVASLPTILGEKIVLRLLNPEDVFLGLRELGLESDQLKALEGAIARPHGMVLVTGPIGSGKTTTLYSILSEIDIFTRNVVTIEDPVEYQLPGINQAQVDSRQDLTFANLLRSVVRQDANVMMVGEIRDADTAHVAVRAAMTGHQVFSTLHTNDAVGAFDTLQHLHAPPYLIAGAVVCVVAQRLVRRVCQACCQSVRLEDAVLAAAGLRREDVGDYDFKKAVGCERCHQTGYRGRTGIFEILVLDGQIREMILRNAHHDSVLAHARSQGMATLMESGLKKVKAGVITLEELLRVTAA